MKMRLLMVLTLFFSLDSFGQQTEHRLTPYNVTNSITISRLGNILRIAKKETVLKTETATFNALKKERAQILKDTFYLFIGNTQSDELDKLSRSLHKLAIKNVRYIVTEAYFTLPYPKE